MSIPQYNYRSICPSCSSRATTSLQTPNREVIWCTQCQQVTINDHDHVLSVYNFDISALTYSIPDAMVK